MKVARVLVVVVLLPLFFTPVGSVAQVDVDIQIVASSWRYTYESSSSSPHRVYVNAEVKNVSANYVSNVAVRATLKSVDGTIITSATDSPIKTTLAPGESSIYSDIIYDDRAFLTTTVVASAFGEPSSAAANPYLTSPDPVYIERVIQDNGRVLYYGEIVNDTPQSWEARCDSWCDAASLTGVYYEGTTIVAIKSATVGPNGHLPPGGRIVFSFWFDRVPGGTFKLFSAIKPMKPGQYATTWRTTQLDWRLAEYYGEQTIYYEARVQNTSDVPADVQVWLVSRDATGKWMGYMPCSSYGLVPPGSDWVCNGYVRYPYDWFVGTVYDVRSIEALAASGVISFKPPPTWTPTATSTATATAIPTLMPTVTPTPTAMRTATPSSTPTMTSTPTVTATATSIPTVTNTPTSTPTLMPTSLLKHVYLPLALK